MKSVSTLLPFVLILLAFYVLIIRPARSRQRAQARLTQSLEVGQQVMTTSGMYAEIAAIDDDAVVLETSPGVTQRWAKPAVARIVTEPDRLDETDSMAETRDTPEPAQHDTTNSVADPDTTGKRPE